MFLYNPKSRDCKLRTSTTVVRIDSYVLDIWDSFIKHVAIRQRIILLESCTRTSTEAIDSD